VIPTWWVKSVRRAAFAGWIKAVVGQPSLQQGAPRPPPPGSATTTSDVNERRSQPGRALLIRARPGRPRRSGPQAIRPLAALQQLVPGQGHLLELWRTGRLRGIKAGPARDLILPVPRQPPLVTEARQQLVRRPSPRLLARFPLPDITTSEAKPPETLAFGGFVLVWAEFSGLAWPWSAAAPRPRASR